MTEKKNFQVFADTQTTKLEDAAYELLFIVADGESKVRDREAFLPRDQKQIYKLIAAAAALVSEKKFPCVPHTEKGIPCALAGKCRRAKAGKCAWIGKEEKG